MKRAARNKRVVFLVNEEEYAQLERNAAQRKMDISKLIRKITLGTLTRMENKKNEE